MTDSWQILSRNGLWCVIDTPNRLWYFDSHTSNLPFYHWLPDDLAFKYSMFSPRETFNTRFRELNQESHIEFMRWGRGVSFHEVQITMSDADLTSKSVSCMSAFVRKKKVLSWLKWRLSKAHKYESLMKSLQPNIHSGFYQPYLNLIIQKR